MTTTPFPYLTLLLNVRWGRHIENDIEEEVFRDVTSFATHVINCASHLRILDLKAYGMPFYYLFPIYEYP